MRYLSLEQILLIHSMIIDETGGSHGVRDRHAISSLAHAPQQAAFGKELYPTVYLKAALYSRDIIMNHPFVDGNKRAGMTSALVFLENNGFVSTAEEGSIEKFALEIINKKLSVADIASWLKKHSKKIK